MGRGGGGGEGERESARKERKGQRVRVRNTESWSPGRAGRIIICDLETELFFDSLVEWIFAFNVSRRTIVASRDQRPVIAGSVGTAD